MAELPEDLVAKHCPSCFIHYAAPRALFSERHEDGGTWYCPSGHPIVFRASEAAKAREERDNLRRERDRLKQNQAFIEEQLRASDAQRRHLKGQITKLTKRIGNGVCPCCSRSFSNLQRHMASQHPQFLEATP